MTFDVAYQKQGFAREAMGALIAMLFNDFAKHRLTAVVDTRNTAAVNLLENSVSAAKHITGRIFSLKARGVMSISMRC
jgi:ribosomal protein S18 acetylase RimI-like enzyme